MRMTNKDLVAIMAKPSHSAASRHVNLLDPRASRGADPARDAGRQFDQANFTRDKLEET
jgi:hypothetical protein